MQKAEDEFEDEEEEDEDKEQPEEPEPETGPPILASVSEDNSKEEESSSVWRKDTIALCYVAPMILELAPPYCRGG